MGDLKGLCSDIFIEVVFRVTLPGCSPEQHFEGQDPQRPDVCLVSVWFAFENLRGHVNRRSYTGFVHLAHLLQVLGKTEVTYFEGVLIYQYVGWLQISMHDIQFDYLHKSAQDLAQNLQSLLLVQLPGPQVLPQIPVFTELCDNVDVVGGQHHILEVDYVRMVELFQNLNFRLNGGAQVAV